MTLEQAAPGRPPAADRFNDNNFDLLRLLAATQVMVVHSAGHFRYNAFFVGVASYFPGVPVFFFISGFLISASWERNPDLRTFARNRILRIFPAYWAAFLFSLAAILLLYRGFDPLRGAGKLALWAAAQLLMLSDWNPDFLRPYGTGVANISLWTIPVELGFYVSIPVLYAPFRTFKNADRVLAIVIVLSFLVEIFDFVFVAPIHGAGMLFKFIGLTPLPWIGMFAIGILAQRNRDFVLRMVAGRFWWFAALYGAVALLTALWPLPPLLVGTTRYMGLINFPCLCLLILAGAYSQRGLAQRLLRRNDISYGIYLFHGPIINILMASGVAGGYGVVLTILCTVPVAVMSWLLIEKPALTAKRWALYRR